jgi:organic hydroperoxide reductase OsmC/OhrA
VLVIRRIHVTYHLKIEPTNREVAERVHGLHADFCPVARTLRGCIAISTALEMENA